MLRALRSWAINLIGKLEESGAYVQLQKVSSGAYLRGVTRLPLNVLEMYRNLGKRASSDL